MKAHHTHSSVHASNPTNTSPFTYHPLNTHNQDVEEWHRGDSEAHENEGEGELYDVGQECLDRIALALGGNTIAPIAQSLFPQLMGDADWRKRHAALICLAQIAEGCVKVMSKNMNSLVQMCLLV